MEKREPEWIPQPGEVYEWDEKCTCRGAKIRGVVISYDPVKRLVHRRMGNGCGERRHIEDVHLVN